MKSNFHKVLSDFEKLILLRSCIFLTERCNVIFNNTFPIAQKMVVLSSLLHNEVVTTKV